MGRDAGLSSWLLPQVGGRDGLDFGRHGRAVGGGRSPSATAHVATARRLTPRCWHTDIIFPLAPLGSMGDNERRRTEKKALIRFD